jgi:hypothetical protein
MSSTRRNPNPRPLPPTPGKFTARPAAPAFDHRRKYSPDGFNMTPVGNALIPGDHRRLDFERGSH